MKVRAHLSGNVLSILSEDAAAQEHLTEHRHDLRSATAGGVVNNSTEQYCHVNNPVPLKSSPFLSVLTLLQQVALKPLNDRRTKSCSNS